MATIQTSLIDDPDMLLHMLQPEGMRYTASGSGTFAAQYTRIDFEHLRLQSIAETRPRILEGRRSPDRAGIMFLLQPSAPVYCNGSEIRPADIAVLNALSPAICHRIEGPAAWASLSFNVDGWTEAGPIMTGWNRPFLPNVPALTPPAEPMERLKRLLRSSIDLAGDVPELLLSSEATRGLQNALMDALVACVHDSADGPCRDAWRHHARIINGFLTLIEERADRPLYLTEICMALKASDRTLRQACHEYFGMGPKRYLLLRRLHLARRALSVATPGVTTVTSIATEFGFWELGRFATAYSRLFGEVPSATLRRSPGRTRPLQDLGAGPMPFSREMAIAPHAIAAP